MFSYYIKLNSRSFAEHICKRVKNTYSKRLLYNFKPYFAYFNGNKINLFCPLQTSLTKFHCNFYSSYGTLGKDIMKSRQKYKKLSYLGMQIFVMKQPPSQNYRLSYINICLTFLLNVEMYLDGNFSYSSGSNPPPSFRSRWCLLRTWHP